MLQDFTFAVRSLGRSRGFTVAAVATLAVGMAANTIVYSIVDALYLRPLPFGDRSARLVTLHSTHPTQAQDWDDSELSYPDLLDLRENAATLEGLEGLITRNLSVSSTDDTVRVMGASVTPGLFALLGVAPRIGRAFNDSDATELGAESVAIISDSLWHKAYGADPAIVGRTVPVNARALTIVGVMPPQFAFPELCDVWLPFRAARDRARDQRNLLAIGLLRPGTALSDTLDDTRRVAAHLATLYPETNRGWSVHAMSMRQFFVGQASDAAPMMVAVSLVLLVACANVASLLVARGIGRQRELMVRTALGASRGRVVRLLMTESLLLAIVGGVLGLFLAGWGLEALVASMPEPPPYWAQMYVDKRILTFALLLGAVTAIASGLLPAVRASRVSLAGGVPLGHRASASPDQRRVQQALVAGQVAVSLALLVGAMLLAKSSRALVTADVGFDPAPLLSFRVYLAGDAYIEPESRAQALDRMLSRLRVLPGVTAVTATGAIPADDGGAGIRLISDRRTGPGEDIGAQHVPITPALFDTLGLRLTDGRTFTEAEALRSVSDVAIVNERLAAQLWPGERAVGRELRVAQASGPMSLRVVGVAPNLVYEELGEETAQSQLIVYVPYARLAWRTMAILVRASGAPAAIAQSARAIVRASDPNFAAYDLLTMTDRRLMTSWGERFLGRTFAVFAIVALLLACLGVYGLTAYAVADRTREIGIRMAIGAQRRDIIGLVLGGGLRLAAFGALIGFPLAFGAARLVESELFRVSPFNASVWIAVPATLVAAVLVASFIPARHATRIDPVVALRQE
jgi:putative ABC transport system permease protein